MDPVVIIVIVGALLLGLALGWWLASRGVAALRTERDTRTEDFKRAIVDLAGAEERAKAADGLRTELATIREDRDMGRTYIATLKAEASAFEARLIELREAKEALSAQFGEVGQKLLAEAQDRFLQRANERFRESEETSGQNLKAMLQPVSDRLQRYEEGVAKVEAERRDAFGDLKGQIEQMRLGQEKVSSEAAKLVNSLRNAPKSRGRWGEQQLKNVLETCGLSEHTDFQTEVSVAGGDEGGRLRPDAIIRVPGGRALVIDAKVSLNAYQDAFGAVDEAERARGLDLHAASMRTHVNGLGNKAYWNQFADAPDYVIMFVPGEHFLSAALEHDPTLWDFAFEKRVLLATPTNLIAIARTVAAVWRQERLAKEAQRIGALGKELYERLAKAASDLRKVGGGLTSAVNNYNIFVSSFETRALVTARKFRDLNIETGAREIADVSPVEALARYGEGAALLEAQKEAAAGVRAVAKYRHTTLPPPYLKRIWLAEDNSRDTEVYPFCLPLFKHGEFELAFDTPTTIIAGENGVGKSTLLEGIAVLAGFDESGGGPGYRAVDNSRAIESGGGVLASALKASWLPKIGQGWFFRADSFFSVARYLDEAGSPSADFLSHSHGEGFIRFFEERCTRPGLFIFDEPESALSPNRQFDFLKLLQRMEVSRQAQVLIATHSPILMAFPGATLLKMGAYGLERVTLEETEHFRIMREFTSDPHGFVLAMIEE